MSSLLRALRRPHSRGLCDTRPAVAERFSFRKFFEEKHFWRKANVGPFFLLLAMTPFLYRCGKDMYWTFRLRRLGTEELISDRYEWLRLNMLRDEVEAVLLQQVPVGGFRPLLLGPSEPSPAEL